MRGLAALLFLPLAGCGSTDGLGVSDAVRTAGAATGNPVVGAAASGLAGVIDYFLPALATGGGAVLLAKRGSKARHDAARKEEADREFNAREKQMIDERVAAALKRRDEAKPG